MSNTKRWSRDWANFDWAQVKKKIAAVEEAGGGFEDGCDIGISKEEFLEYLDWLNQNYKEGYYKAVLSIHLARMGFNESQVQTALAHPDELIKIIESGSRE